MSETASQSAPQARPAGVTVIAVILVLEALSLLTAAGWYLYGLLTSTPTSLGGAIFTLVFLVVLALWLVLVSYHLVKGYRWTRSAALVFQLFVIVIAVPTLSAGIIPVGLALLVPAAAVLLVLFTKPVLAYTSRTGDNPKVL
ncbi:hypothetical protein [Arthrobacter sp. CAN_C5]|uniref:hypothetical protein n=1 Tax=Arthrobacter sp. CAN_C5 TaxID=2760706 RepID=UPI001AE511B6|nr:hypothetical protein [Arthrobacter sp. CAN_C5]MBP2215940.1 hypothetical protein [Arthrobacter sp. CAN_C5]